MLLREGGTGVLGRHFVNAIVQAGGIAIILGLNEERGNAQVEEIKRNGGEVIFLKVNVLDELQLVDAKERIIQKYDKIDGLVNAAGGNVPEGVLNPGDDVFNLNIEGMKEAMELICGALLYQIKSLDLLWPRLEMALSSIFPP